MNAQLLYEGVSRHEWGKSNIGGSDIAPIVGKSNFKTALDLYLEKTGQKEPDPPTRKMEVGTIMEPHIRRWASEDLGMPIADGEAYRDAEYPYLGGNTDGSIDADTMVEIKTMDFMTRDKWGEPGTDEIPIDYYIQVTWYMGIGGFKRCLMVRYDTGSKELEYYWIDFQADLYAECRRSAIRFMENMRKGIAPDPTGRDGDNIVYLFPKGNEEIVIADDAVDAIASEMGAIYPELKKLERQYDELKSRMKVAIGPNKGIETLCGKFTLSRLPGRVKWENVAKEFNPTTEIIAKHTGEPSTTLRTPFKEPK